MLQSTYHSNNILIKAFNNFSRLYTNRSLKTTNKCYIILSLQINKAKIMIEKEIQRHKSSSSRLATLTTTKRNNNFKMSILPTGKTKSNLKRNKNGKLNFKSDKSISEEWRRPRSTTRSVELVPALLTETSNLCISSSRCPSTTTPTYVDQ